MNMNLEESFAQLERIAQKMESSNVSLGDSIALFEEGQGLIAHCEALLNEAQNKIEQTCSAMAVEQ